MIIRGKEKWKEVIEAQKQSGLTIKKYCNDNPICISRFYKQKALILDEENIFCFQTASMEPKQVERRTA